MAITASDIRTDEIETTTTPTRVRPGRVLAIGAASIVAVASLVATAPTTHHESTPPATPTSAMSMTEKLQNLVDRGFIPRQALLPAPLTMDQKLQNLVDRGLIPRGALELRVGR